MQGGRSVVEILEQRRLLTQVGVDYTFGQAGTVAAGSDVLFEQVGNKLLTVSDGEDGSKAFPYNVHLLTLDGDDDPAFGNGKGVFVPGLNERALAAVDGNRVLVMYTTNLTELDVTAINLDGTIDQTFGKAGVADVPIPAPPTGQVIDIIEEYGIAATADGGAVLALTYSYNNGSIQTQVTSALFKITASGALDTSWGNNGVFALQTAQSADISALQAPQIATDSDGNITAVAGTGGPMGDAAIVRITAQGKPDTSFGSNGRVDLKSVESTTPYDDTYVAVQSDGKVVIAGSIFGERGDHEQLLRLSANGKLDTSFGESGIDTFPDIAFVDSLHLDSQDRILFATFVSVTRFTADGQLDTSFNDSGVFPLTDTLEGSDVALDSSGQLYLINALSTTKLGNVSPAVLSQNGILFVTGTSGNDQIGISNNSGQIHATVNDQTFKYDPASVKQIFIQDEDGDDNIASSIDVSTTVSGGGGNDTITTGGGDDRIMCGPGNDSIDAGAGNDYVHGSTGSYTIQGGAGNDTLNAPGSVSCVIFGGDGNDSMEGGDGNDLLYGGAGKDTVYGNEGDDYLSGGGGKDHLFGQQGSDTLYGGKGDDAIQGGPGSDLISGQAGNDKLFAADGEADSVYGGDGNDIAAVDNGLDTLKDVETVS